MPEPSSDIRERRAWPAATIGRRLAVGLALVVVLTAGCTRARYRERADNEVYRLIDCGSRDPRWALDDYGIDVNPQSRMHSPYDPDCPPMPPDDPTSHQLMHCVDGKRGWPCWDKCGTCAATESPGWQAFLPRNDAGEIVLDRQAAVELALLESPDYQRAKESLYLSALDVTLERYRFDVQFFGGNSTFFTSTGPLAGQANSSNRLSNDTSLGFTKACAAGGQLLVEAANSVVWEFSGNDGYSVLTPISFSFFQPLLRGAGRAVVLESLTESERALLANIRQMERYRRGFYLRTVSGRNPGTAPSSGRLGLTSFSPGGGGGVGGFFSLLEQELQIRNQRANVAALRSSFDQVNEFNQVGLISRTQVDEILQNLYSSQIGLLSRIASYESELDNYVVTLGLPPQLKVRVEDPMLRPFNLIDPELNAVQEDVSRLSAQLRDPEVAFDSAVVSRAFAGLSQGIIAVVKMVEQDFQKLDAALPERRASLRQLAQREEFRHGDVDPRLVDVTLLDNRVSQLKTGFVGILPRLQATLGATQYRAGEPGEAIRTIEESMQTRDGGDAADWYYLAMASWQIDQKAQGRQAFEKAAAWTDANDPNDLRLGLLRAEAAELLGLADTLPDWIRELERKEGKEAFRRTRIIRLLASQMTSQLGELSLVQAGVRLDAATLVPVEMSPEVAIATAACNRLDWMNARAALVDRWRQVEVVANRLKSDLNVSVDGDITPRSDTLANTFNTTGSVRVGVEFDAPLSRLAERNAYRAVLIDFQQARRQYYNYADRVDQSLRDTLRSIRLSQIQFELLRASVRTAITRVDQQQTALQEPPRPGEENFTFGPTTARDIVTALGSLLSAQNAFLDAWVQYEVLRMDLDFDLGTMQLDNCGMWIDPGPIDASDAAPPKPPEEVPLPELPLTLTAMADPQG